ncbi:unnamed protein product [Moneuplotes crassus]|uniref:GPR180/TMEM145 transmembrane domain-containing protein n=1 Tax=Euplotes crassus TaxID=5936 RepID=A0AAD1UT59_EUPCR|nr:unnamed protein product [Moneuplotes crassus]
MKIRGFQIVLVLLLPALLRAAFITGSTTIDTVSYTKYIARFAVNQDSILDVKLRTRFQQNYNQNYVNVKLLLMNDAEWDMALESDLCADREKLARFNINIRMQSNGQWSQWGKSKVRIINRPQVWYMLLADCDRETNTEGINMKTIDFELEMTNDESHFSHEYWGVLPTNVFALLVFSYLLGKTGLKLYNEIKKQEEYQSPLMPLLVALVLEFLQLILCVMHLICYSYDGRGIWLFDYFQTIFSILAQITLISLMIMISQGWTLVFGDLAEKNYFKTELIINFGVHIFIGLLTVIDNGEAHKYHDFEGFQGLLLILLRLGIYGYFLYNVKEIMRNIPRKNLKFMKGFIISASIYMLSFPAFWICSYLLNPHRRLKFIHFGNLFMQMISILILVNQITKKESTYNKASMRSQGILPNTKAL